jgi:hypothetical protein
MDPGMFGAGWTPGFVRICQDRRRISTMDRHRIDEGIPTMPL